MISGNCSKLLKILEARVGIEPTHKGFADLSLTTWVPRLGRGALRPFESFHSTVPSEWPAPRHDRMERETRFELATLALARRCSTTELLPLDATSSIPGRRKWVKPRSRQHLPRPRHRSGRHRRG